MTITYEEEVRLAKECFEALVLRFGALVMNQAIVE